MIGDKIFLKESGGITKDSLFENVQSSFIRIHPWSTLTVSIINRRGVPRDAKLSSDECLVVFEAISMFTDGSKIAPSMFIDHQKKFIDKKDVAEYESVLREFLRVSDSELLSKILETLKKPLSKAFENNDSISPRNGFENSEHIKVSIIQSMMKLAESKMLPAIVFLFDRNGCESGARIISEYLEQCETKSREKDLSYIQKKEEAIKKSLAPKNQQKKKGKKMMKMTMVKTTLMMKLFLIGRLLI